MKTPDPTPVPGPAPGTFPPPAAEGAARGEEARRWRRGVVRLLLIAWVVRLLVALPGLRDPEHAFFRPDSIGYIGPATALFETGRYTAEPGSDQPAVQRPPGFPLLVTAFLAMGGGDWRLPVLFFCAISALTCLPVALAGRDACGARCGMLAGWLFALNITSVAVAPLFLSDTLYGLIVAWQLVFFARFARGHRVGDAATAFALAGIGSLVRPIGLPWVLLALAFALALGPRSLRRRVGLALGCSALFAAATVPWMARNCRVGAGFRLDTSMGNTLYYHTCGAMMSVLTGEPAPSIRDRWKAETEAEFAAHPERYPDAASRVEYQLARARELARRHPLVLLRVYVQPGMLLPDAPTFLQLLGLDEGERGTLDVLIRQGLFAAIRHYFRGQPWLWVIVLPLVAVVLLSYLGCAVTAARWLVRREWSALFLFAMFGVYFLLAPGPIVAPRYQIPALPVIVLMAAAAWPRRPGSTAGA